MTIKDYKDKMVHLKKTTRKAACRNTSRHATGKKTSTART